MGKHFCNASPSSSQFSVSLREDWDLRTGRWSFDPFSSEKLPILLMSELIQESPETLEWQKSPNPDGTSQIEDTHSQKRSSSCCASSFSGLTGCRTHVSGNSVHINALRRISECLGLSDSLKPCRTCRDVFLAVTV